MKTMILPIVLILVFCSSQTEALQKESPHFVYFYEEADSSIIDSVISRLEGAYNRITGDLQLIINGKTNVHIYPTLQQFHDAIGWSDAPDWLVGVAWGDMYVVSPLNPGPVHSYSSILNNVFIHEFTHICTGKINRSIPQWLSEGFACYEGGPYYSKSSVVSAYNNLGRIPTLDELADSYDSFANLGGYPFSLTIAYFMVNTFGMDATRSFIYYPRDYSVFAGLTKDQFEQQWFDYVNKNYLGITAAGLLDNTAPTEFILYPNYPNPFNAISNFGFSIPPFQDRSSNSGKVTLKIYDLEGNEIATVVNEELAPGRYIYKFDASSAGGGLASGVYLYRLNAGGFHAVRKMILLK